MDKNRFLYEGFIKFYLLPEKNLFIKYKDIFKNFFIDLFTNENSCVKKLFIKTFPVLEENYFISKDFLDFVFEKKFILLTLLVQNLLE